MQFARVRSVIPKCMCAECIFLYVCDAFLFKERGKGKKRERKVERRKGGKRENGRNEGGTDRHFFQRNSNMEQDQVKEEQQKILNVPTHT